VTARPTRPTTGSGVAFGLEVWLIGTHTELDAALAALATAGRINWQGIGKPGRREPLGGADTGRYRAYAHLYVPAVRVEAGR
jgi:hypothetical protein